MTTLTSMNMYKKSKNDYILRIQKIKVPRPPTTQVFPHFHPWKWYLQVR